jgi:hypothetical protein
VFAGGEASVSGFRFYAATTSLTVLEEGTTHAGSATITVKPGPPKRWAWANATVTEGSILPPCLFACESISSGRQVFVARVSVTDEWGNVVSNLGGATKAKVNKTGGGGLMSGNREIAIPAAGPAESSPITPFEYRSPNSGTGEASLRLLTESGMALTEAGATVRY